jgi:hypothetical protein
VGEAKVEVGRFLVHVYHSREDITLAYFLFHEGNCFGEKGFNLGFLPTVEKLWACGDEGIDKHGAVLAGLAACLFDTGVYLLPIPLARLDNMKVVLAAGDVNIRIAGVSIFGTLMVRLQRSGGPRLVLCKP